MVNMSLPTIKHCYFCDKYVDVKRDCKKILKSYQLKSYLGKRFILYAKISPSELKCLHIQINLSFLTHTEQNLTSDKHIGAESKRRGFTSLSCDQPC